ncbi:hypothetical protein LJC55_02660 [Eubacteriales bacterium OttesenSCG-928-N14]|nr:hypothetical protein [Eubacteriales bacterium OttesenSCG-928-N14]
MLEDTICKLVAIVNSSDRENTDYFIAMGLLKSIDSIANSSIEQMAEHCDTSTASLSRFCRKMGFQNYVLFKNEFNKSVSQTHERVIQIYFRITKSMLHEEKRIPA